MTGTERSETSRLAVWIGGQLKALGRNLRAGGTTVAPKWYAVTTVTTAGGAVSVTLPDGYFVTAVAAAWIIPVRDTAAATSATFATVRARTIAQVTGQVWESRTTGVLVLNTTVEGIEPAASGLAVDVVVLGY